MIDQAASLVNSAKHAFPEIVIEPGHEDFERFRSAYWSGNQRELKPACVARPRNSQELARVVNFCAKTDTHFAVRSGGHGHYAGQSSINNGLQIDLGGLRDILVAHDRTTVRIGSGNTWAEVYEKLEPQGLMVVGGRAASVGVGGFVLGGGISFYAARYGWSLGTVRGFEVALPDGRVVSATRESEVELYNAIRGGGGSSLGVIASFELELFPYSGIWGGFRVLRQKHLPQAIDAYVDFLPKLSEDSKGHNILSLNYDDDHGLKLHQLITYTEPILDPPLFTNVRAVPSIQEDLGLTQYSVLAKLVGESQNGRGARQALSTVTIRPHNGVLTLACEWFMQEAANLSQIAQATMEIHSIPRHYDVDNHELYGIGNSDTLICLVIAFSTQDPVHDKVITQTQAKIINKIKIESANQGVSHPFLYMNYAAKFQDVIGSYGAETQRLLRKAAHLYDPDQVFQRLNHNSFRLSGGREEKTTLD